MIGGYADANVHISEKPWFSGKTIVLFCIHAGSKLSARVFDIQAACPDVMVSEMFAIQGSMEQNDRNNPKEATMERLEKYNFAE